VRLFDGRIVSRDGVGFVKAGQKLVLCLDP
jgi:hypothetical protein